MKLKKSNVIVSAICMAALSAASFHSGYAAGNSDIQYNSQGKIVFDNGTENTVDDVIFDASDFLTIDSLVTKGKTDIRDELNKYDSINLDGGDVPSFDTLAASVDALSDGTDATAGDILEGKTALVGKSIVAGSMDDHSGSSTNAGSISENGTNAEITIPGGYYDGDSKISIPVDTLMKLPTISGSIGSKYELYASNVQLPYTLPANVTDAIFVLTSASGSASNGNVGVNTVIYGGETFTVSANASISTSYNKTTHQITFNGSISSYCNRLNSGPSGPFTSVRGDVYVKY